VTNHTIQIFNQSGVARSYVLFMQPPQTGATQIFANAWVTFDSVTSGGFDSVTYDNSVYAYWGTTPDTFAPGTVVSSGGVALVDLTKSDEVPFSGAQPTGFGAITEGRGPPGSFSIVSGANFSPASGFLFGWAKAATTPVPVPVATTPALPNMVVTFTPGSQVFVAAYSCVSGQVIDVTEISNTAEVDFTGKPQTTATVIQGADGTFVVDYT
jgi:hypothetical protein